MDPETVFCTTSPVPLLCWVLVRLPFPGSQGSWLPAGFIPWEALDGDGTDKGRGKSYFSPSPCLSWVVSPGAVASLPGL